MMLRRRERGLTDTGYGGLLNRGYRRPAAPSPRPRRTNLVLSIWKSEVSFGLVNVPVKVYSATEDHDLHARQVDKKDGVRIRYKKV